MMLLLNTNAIDQQVCNLGLPNTWINSTFTSNATYNNTDIIIANNHPNIGGQAVHLARAILGLYIIDIPINASSTVARTGTTNTQTNNPKTDYLNAYPNPANNYYTIDIAGDYTAIINYEIYSTTGSLIQSGSINNNATNKLNISDINSGIYFIKLFDDNEIIYNSKLIKN